MFTSEIIKLKIVRVDKLTRGKVPVGPCQKYYFHRRFRIERQQRDTRGTIHPYRFTKYYAYLRIKVCKNSTFGVLGLRKILTIFLDFLFHFYSFWRFYYGLIYGPVL